MNYTENSTSDFFNERLVEVLKVGQSLSTSGGLASLDNTSFFAYFVVRDS